MTPSAPGDHTQMPTVAMVVFSAGLYRVALESRHVVNMTDTPSTSRYVEAANLLFQHTEVATQWLTLNDDTGAWQLGVNTPITLHAFAANKLYPLPPLLKARRLHPTLCGIAFEPQPLLLLDALALTPPTISS